MVKGKRKLYSGSVIHLRPTGPARRVNIIDAISKMAKNSKADLLDLYQ